MEKFLKYGFLSFAFHAAVLCAVVSLAGYTVVDFVKQNLFAADSQTELLSETLNEELTEEDLLETPPASKKKLLKKKNPKVKTLKTESKNYTKTHKKPPQKKIAGEKKQPIKKPPLIKEDQPLAPKPSLPVSMKTAETQPQILEKKETLNVKLNENQPPVHVQAPPLAVSSAPVKKEVTAQPENPVPIKDNPPPSSSADLNSPQAKTEDQFPTPEYPDDKQASLEEETVNPAAAAPAPRAEEQEEEPPPAPKVVVVKENQAEPQAVDLVNNQSPGEGEKNSKLSSQSSAQSYTSLIPVAGNPQPVYPDSAREKKQQGSVFLLYFVDEGGLVDKIQLIRSSGHTELDNSALRTLSRYRYQPGQEGWYKHRVDFKLTSEQLSQNP